MEIWLKCLICLSLYIVIGLPIAVFVGKFIGFGTRPLTEEEKRAYNKENGNENDPCS